MRGVCRAARRTGAGTARPGAARAGLLTGLAVLCLWLACSAGALAQRVPIPSTAEPGAVERSIPLQQVPETSGQDLRVPTAPPTKAPAGAESVLFNVSEIQIVGATALSQEQLAYAASDVLYLHALWAKLESLLIREDRLGLAEACFAFLPARGRLDLLGYEQPDLFAH